MTNYIFDRIEAGADDESPLPLEAVAQAGRAARNGVDLNTFLIELIEVHSLLGEFVADEAAKIDARGAVGAQLVQLQIFRRLAIELSREYRREKSHLAGRSDQYRRGLVHRLLSGAPGISSCALGYRLEVWHVGLIAVGSESLDATEIVAERLGVALLSVPMDMETTWVWIGSSRMISSQLIARILTDRKDLRGRYALGQPAYGLEGWRATHLEARSTLTVALCRQVTVTLFSDVALEALSLQTPDLARSLLVAYLTPLIQRGGRTSVLFETLKAFFGAGGNASSAATSLGVTRRTVENRLREVEKRLGQSIGECGSKLDLALRLYTLMPSLVDDLLPPLDD
jgi:hypothetical protein